MILNHFLKTILLAAVALITVGCQTDTVYYSYLPIHSEGWKRSDTLEFVLPDSLCGRTYELGIGVRHKGKYPYRDLWLELTQYLPRQDSLKTVWIEKKDTFHIYLANERGKWNSNGTTGGFYQLLTPCSKIALPSFSNVMDKGPILPVSKVSVTETDQKSELADSKLKLKRKYTFLGTEISVAEDAKQKLKLVHIMTDSVLPHITDVGIQLRRPMRIE